MGADSCVEAGCKNERDRLGPRGEDLQRCRDHRCSAEACPGLRRDHGHCETHTCAHADCRAVVRPDAGRFCDAHRRCRTDGCDEPVRRRGANRPPAFCREHACRAEGCGRPAAAAGDFCHGHTCAAPECRDARAEGGHYHYYCGRHRCAEPRCRAQRVRGPRCADHRPCARAGCAAFVDADCRACCRAHTCDVAGCAGARPAGGGRFCGAHACRRRGCRDRAVGDEGLCAGHGAAAASREGEGDVGLGPEPAPGGECVAM